MPFAPARYTACTLLLAVACASDHPSDKHPELAGVQVVKEDSSSDPLANLSSEWMGRFTRGDVLFEQTFFDAEGLGPVYIRSACSGCHLHDSRGPGAVRKMVMLGDDGEPLADQSALSYGHTIRPQTSMGVREGIVAPEDTSRMLITVRQPPAVFGRGYLEAIDDAEIQRVEDEQADRDDGVSGRINWVTYASQPNPDTRFHAHVPGERLIGRFGLKARVATLDDFTADAYQGDMGITTDMRPDELPNPAGDVDDVPGIDLSVDNVNAVADYMRMLRIPARKPDEGKGAALFESTQCSACHVPSLHTQANYPIPQLADRDAPVYSDLLLHDMGPSFADGLNDYDAGSSEWRTAPLLGLRHLKNYLHDGRAESISEAIEMHGAEGSEARASVQKFRALDDKSRALLLAYVSAL
jgi:CxxC motif-containing protein (DUF1111 family)